MTRSRLSAAQSVLLVVDVQDKLLKAIPTAAELVKNAGFLLDVAALLGVPALATEQYRWVPQALLRYPLRTDEVLPRVKTPLLLVHGQDDALIAAAHSQRLMQGSPQAKLLIVPSAGHGDIHKFDLYLDGLSAALSQASAGISAAPPVPLRP